MRIAPLRVHLWLCALFVYYPIHPTVYAVLTKLWPSVPSPLFSVWQDLVILSLFGIGLLRAVRQSVMRFTLVDLAVAFWLGTALPSAINSDNLRLSIYGFRLTYLPVLLYFSVRLLPFRNPIRYQQIVAVILAVGTAVAVAGILLYFVAPPTLLVPWYLLNHFVIGYYQGIRRMDSVFWSAPVFGGLMALSATLCLAFVFSVPKPRQLRNKYFTGFFLFSFCCIMSLSRGSWLAEATGIAAIAFMKRRRKLGLAIAATSLVATGIVASRMVAGSENPLIAHVATIFSEPELGTGQIGRAEQREGGWQDIMQHPFGHGLGQSGHVASWFSDEASNVGTVVADNWYLKMWQESGILGVVCFSGFMLSLILYLLSNHRHGARGFGPSLIVGVTAVFLGVSVQGYGSNVWDFYMVNSICWVLIGVVINVTQTRSVVLPTDATRWNQQGTPRELRD